MGGIETLAVKAAGGLFREAMKKDSPVHDAVMSFGKTLSSKIADKLADTVDHVADKFSGELDSNLQTGLKSASQSLAALGLSGPMMGVGRIDYQQALATFQSFDADGNGAVSRTELTDGLKTMDQQLVNKLSGGTLSASEKNTLNAQNKLYHLGQAVLSQYQAIAGLDGDATGLSASDLATLARGDNRADQISWQDWRSLAHA